MDKQVLYGRLVIKSAQKKDNKVLNYINKPDPIILGIKQRLALFILDILYRINYNKT